MNFVKQLFLICLFLAYSEEGISQLSWAWNSSIGSGTYQIAQNYGEDLDFDANGNTYAVGCIDSGTTVPNHTITSYGQYDAVIIKYDPQGVPMWIVTGGGTGWDVAKRVSVSDDGYLYVMGYFYNSAIMGTQALSAWGMGFFLAKLDTNGNFIWVKQGDGIAYSTQEKIMSVEIGSDGNIYIAGLCAHNSQLIGTTYVSSLPYSGAAFFEKLDTAGNMLEVFYHRGAGGANKGLDFCLDGNNNLYYTLSRARADTIINGPNSWTGYHNLVLGRLDATLSLMWYKEYGDTSNYIWRGTPESVTIDANGDLYVCGFYGQFFYLQSGPYGNGGFTCKFNPNNGSVISARPLNPLNNTAIFFGGADYDNTGNVIYSGAFVGTVDFGGVVLDPYGPGYNSDIFIASYDTTDLLNWVLQYGYSKYECPLSSRINHNRFGCTGSFQDSLTIGTTTVYQDTLTSNWYYFFTAVTEESKTDIEASNQSGGIQFDIFPNPAVDEIRFETNLFPQEFVAQIFSSSGQLLLTQDYKQGNVIQVTNLDAGFYFLTVSKDQLSISKPFIIK